MNQRIPLTAETQMPICSITKQFVCALLLDLQCNPSPAMAAKGDIREQVSDKLRELLRPEIMQDGGLTLENLYNMQSGLRDYWAMTTLWGAQPDDAFLIERDGPAAMDRTRSFMFHPGTEYSYSNVNFYVLARALEHVTGEPLAKLLADRVLGPAGMKTAFLCPDTAQTPPPCVGYEGTESTGYCAAVNRIEWAGDAGLVASLTDLLSWEQYLERQLSDPESWYQTPCATTTYSDGNRAFYHCGMLHVGVNGVDSLGHGGALRGYRLHRRHVPREHLSVVAMFNHEANASAAVDDVLRGIMNAPSTEDRKAEAAHPPEASADWTGVYLDQDTQLAITVTPGTKVGQIQIARSAPEVIELTDAVHGRSAWMSATIEGDTLHVHRIAENRRLVAQRLIPRNASLNDATFRGDYECAEVASVFHCHGHGAVLYGSFDGYLGCGPATALRYLGGDVWSLACPRGLDAPAPGNWTLVVRRNDAGLVNGVTIGCWLARRLDFVKQEERR